MTTTEPRRPFLRRAVARALDLALHVGVIEVAARLSDRLPGPALQLGEQTLMSVDIAVGLVALVAYPAVAEWAGGATFGKLLFRLCVEDQDGAPLAFSRAVVRNAALPVDLFFFGLIAYSAMSRSPLHQRVGDGWGRTVVGVRPGVPPRRAIGGACLGVGVALAVLLGSYVIA